MSALFVFRPDSMPASGPRELVEVTAQRWMRFYCWPCATVHEFALKDVERIVYALGTDAAFAWDDAHAPSGDDTPECLNRVLGWVTDTPPEYGTHALHVQQGVECRERADG